MINIGFLVVTKIQSMCEFYLNKTIYPKELVKNQWTALQLGKNSTLY